MIPVLLLAALLAWTSAAAAAEAPKQKRRATRAAVVHKKSMEDMLEKGFQGKVITTGEPGKTTGAQRPRKRSAKGAKKPSGQHLRVVLSVGQDGTAEVLSVTELPGEAPLDSAPRGNTIYEFTEGEKTIVAEGLPGDPFEGHSFGEKKGHSFVKLPRATIVTMIPDRSQKSALEGLNFRLYRLQGDANLRKINRFEMAKLKTGGQLKTLVHLPSDKLGPALRAGSSANLVKKPAVIPSEPKAP